MEKQLCTYSLLEILEEKTDSEKTVQMSEILKTLEEDYEMKVRRHKVYSTIRQLRSLGYKISYDKYKKGYRLEERYFTKSEVLLLCNAVHASNFITQKDSDILINKLIKTLPEIEKDEFHEEVFKPNPKKMDNQELMKNIAVVSKAIYKNHKISFQYLHYEKDRYGDLKLQLKYPKIIVVEPRYICYIDGRPYLIIQGGRLDGFMHYRLDRMTNIIELNEKCTTTFNRQDAYEYANNKLFMFCGKEVTVTIRLKKRVLDAMIDVFGKPSVLLTIDEDHYQFSKVVNDNGIVFLAQQYLDAIEIIDPPEIRERIKNVIKKTSYIS